MRQIRHVMRGLIYVSLVSLLLGCGLKVSNEKEPAEEMVSTASPPEEKNPLIEVTGELFVTTRSGDVKKAAGQKVHVVPLTPEWKDKVTALHDKGEQLVAEYERVWDESFAKHHAKYDPMSLALGGGPEAIAASKARDKEYGPVLDRLRAEVKGVEDAALVVVLPEGTRSIAADGDGKFRLELPSGEYVLWAGPRSMGKQMWYWCRRVSVRDSSMNLVLSEDSVYQCNISYHFDFEPLQTLLRALVSP